jgi:hypothetical protein
MHLRRTVSAKPLLTDVYPSSISRVTSLRTAGTASTPDFNKAQLTKQHSRTTDSQEVSLAELPDAKNVSGHSQNPMSVVRKERSSSYGASWTTSQSGHASSQPSNTGFSLNREPSGTHRSMKSSKDDGFKVSLHLQGYQKLMNR